MTNPTNPLEAEAPQTAHQFIEMRGIGKRFGGDSNGGFGKVLGLFLSLVLLQIIWGATMILVIRAGARPLDGASG